MGLIPTPAPCGWLPRLHFNFAQPPLPLLRAPPPPALLTITSHRRAATVPLNWAKRTASTPSTYCTKFLSGVPATKAGQRSFPLPSSSSASTIVVNRLLSFPSQADEPVSTASLHRHSPTTPSLPTTYCPPRWQASSTARALYHR
jgi:hypothetical protein